MHYRIIKTRVRKRPTLEGAGVRLHRVFGFSQENTFDPFLLLDDFSSNRGEDLIKGFPWHPHRGIETITYMIRGKVEHQDSMGNKGIIQSGGVQWMTAGSGIIHQEMPVPTPGWVQGFQLWANLPKTHKMMDPRYREITSNQIPIVTLDDKVEIRILAGEINGIKGPVTDVITNPEYYDITFAAEAEWEFSTSDERTVLVYVIDGSIHFEPSGENPISTGELVSLVDGDAVFLKTTQSSGRVLLICGDPLHEPVAWRGPIVMNTEEELRVAFREYQEGTFIKAKDVSI